MAVNHLFHCHSCGTEVRSVFSGAELAIVCSEACPKCGQLLPSPQIFGPYSIGIFEDAATQPMIRNFGVDGSDGYIFMGQGDLIYEIVSPALSGVLVAYNRNIDRAIELLEIYYEVQTDRRQLLLAAILITIMTSYECLTDDLQIALIDAGLVPSTKRKGSLAQRRGTLFDALDMPGGGNVIPLQYLYAYRNCLTHNAGIVDEDFIKTLQKIDSIPSKLTAYTTGMPLMLDASTAISFADTLQHVAHQLFRAAQDKFTKLGK